MPLQSTLFAVAGLLVLALFLYAVLIYNDLVRLRVNVDKAWGNLDVLLKQRHDEVPNLVAVVRGAKDFEAGLLLQVTEARAASQAALGPEDRSRAESRLGSSLGRLIAVAEKYPSLTAQENFLKLQKRLSALEDEIADRRAFFNDSTALYNARIAQFPDVLMAGACGFAPRVLFQADAAERPPVPVGGIAP